MNNAIHVKEFGLDVIYRHDYEKGQNAGNIKKYVEQSCLHFKKFLANIPNSGEYRNFLDIGCGNAQVLDFFEKEGLCCKGIDLYPQDEDGRIIEGDFYKLQEYGVKDVDVVFINHTLEHSLAPLLLEQIRKVHNIGGALFIAVPDADYPWAYDITSSTTHWSIFNEGFLRVLLQRFGYEVCVEKECFRERCGELFAYAIKRW